MIRLVLDNQNVTIQGASEKALRLLQSCTSYLVEGYRFSPAFRAHHWDGRTRLMEYVDGHYRVPIGMLGAICRALSENELEYELKRRVTPKRDPVEYDWNESIVMRPYQLEAVEAFLSQPSYGRGILKMPIRSGKTKTAARIIWRLKCSALFLVPSQMLLHQTVESLKEALPGADVGIIGDGNWEPGTITVATLQSLLAARGEKAKTCKGNLHSGEDCPCGKRKCNGGRKYLTPRNKVYDEFMNDHDLVIFDEVHHATGDAWRNVVMDSNARYRLGLSATIYFDYKSEVDRGVLWVRACTGDIKFEVGVSDLIEQGYLMRQNVKMYKVDEPKKLSEMTTWNKSIISKGIWANENRNGMIVKLTEKALQDGYRNVLIATNSLEQVREIDALLDSRNIDHGIITGATKGEARTDIVNQFKRNDFRVILGTVFGEGVDIPEVECVINAEGGKDAKKTVQRMRNMTMVEGKTKAMMIDFFDAFNRYTKRHSSARLKTYQEEKAFLVEKMW